MEADRKADRKKRKAGTHPDREESRKAGKQAKRNTGRLGRKQAVNRTGIEAERLASKWTSRMAGKDTIRHHASRQGGGHTINQTTNLETGRQPFRQSNCQASV